MFGRISETVSGLAWTISSSIWHSLIFLYIFKPCCSLLIRRYYAIANKTNTESLIFFHISAISEIFVKSICCVKREEQNEPIHIPLRLQAFNNRFVVLSNSKELGKVQSVHNVSDTMNLVECGSKVARFERNIRCFSLTRAEPSLRTNSRREIRWAWPVVNFYTLDYPEPRQRIPRFNGS